jgi:hypothetical protein
LSLPHKKEQMHHHLFLNNIRKEIVVKSKGSENYINRNDDLSRFQYPTGLRLYGLAHGLKAYI